MWISPSSDDTSVLAHNAWLSTLLLDCILQQSVASVDSTSTDTFHIGSLGTQTYIQSMNNMITHLPRRPNAVTVARANRQQKIACLRAQMRYCFRSRPISRRLIPIVLGRQFFVFCLDCLFATSEFIVNLKIYDSLQH